MSPFPSKINLDSIVQTTIDMIETEGVDKLSVNKLAERLGVKTPSLYRYVNNKTDLLRAVNEATIAALFQSLTPVLEITGDTQTKILTVACEYRNFALANPVAYGLVYTNTIAELRPDESEAVRGVLPFQGLMAQISGEADSLTALRGLLALIHGFVMLELAGQLRRGGDLEAAFIRCVEAYITGWL